MKKRVVGGLILVVLLFVAGCTSTTKSIKNAHISSVAVVTLGVNNYGTFGTRGVIAPALIVEVMPEVLTRTEAILGKKLTVKPAASFVKEENYRSLAIGKAKKGLYTPSFDGTVMPSFSENRQEVIKGVLKPETARSLCKTLGVDAVVLVYSEWMIDAGKFVPTIKALTKNCFAMYDKDGTKLFYDRKDLRGDKIIGGAFAGVRINEDTISQWVEAYSRAAEEVLLRHL